MRTCGAPALGRRRSARTASLAAVNAALLLVGVIAGPAVPAITASLGPIGHVAKVSGASAAAVGAAAHPASSSSAAQAAPSKSVEFAGSLRSAPKGARRWASIGASGAQVALVGASTTAAAVRVKILSSPSSLTGARDGIAVSIERIDGGPAALVAVRLPAAFLAGYFGADGASRLRWSSPAKRTATATTITGTATKRITVLSATTRPVSATGTGDFTATPLSTATSWQVSAQTGDFSWEYPMRTPPAAAGPAPDLALDYDSQSVDGATGSTNNQPSAIGDGWSLSGAGFIERRYVSCSLDDGPSGPVTTSGDQCWKTDNATISFAGHSGTLVKDATTGVWRMQSDDGTRFEHLVGTAAGCKANGTYDTDCWRMTTTDGTQYWFGLNQLPGWTSGQPKTASTWTVPVFGNDIGEPCHDTTFGASSCMQAWRWNLDYIVDTHGNAESFYYDAETNEYAQNNGSAATYTRGGQLDHIDYGFTDGNAYATNAASDRVRFGYAANGRCSDTAGTTCTAEPLGAGAAPATPSSYPDVPFDQLCAGSACPDKLSPTFWTTAQLDTVTTQVLKAGAYSTVDTWALGHSYPSPGDTTDPVLWLTQVVHTGGTGNSAISEPATIFTGATYQNRVWVKDGLAPLDRYRITAIRTSLGAVIGVNYSTQQCTAGNAATIEANANTNTNRCYPQWWSPQVVPAQAPQLDLFHKYVVTSVTSNPETGGGLDQTQETDYVYTGTPAWRWDTSPLTPNSRRTWSIYAGYDKVEIRVGSSATPTAQQTTDYVFYRGMNGDRANTAGGTKTVNVTGTTIPDSLWFAGFTQQTKILLGVGGAVQSTTTNTPWASAVTANDGTATARFTGTASTLVSEPTSTGTNRTVTTTTAFDPTYGLPTTVQKAYSDAPTTCEATTYAAPNTSAWIIGLASEVKDVAVACANLATAVYPAAAISDVRSTYDGGTVGSAATVGDVTTTESVDSYTGQTPHWSTATQTAYDSLGRVTQTTDSLGHTLSTSYVPAAGAVAGSGATTSITTTNTAPYSWTSTTTYDPAWGVELTETDANNKVTSASYDALGRRTAVWYPDNPRASFPNQPSLGYAYTLSTTGTNAIATTTLRAIALVTTYDLYDGLGNRVQTQAPAEGGGTTLTDQFYDTAGRPYLANNAYWTVATNPSSNLFVPTSENQIASENVTTYDARGRVTASILYSAGNERYRTTTIYNGADRVDVNPPAGGTPTTTISDTQGRKTQLIQYLAAAVSSTATKETTTYAYTPRGSMSSMTDPSGNAWTWGYDVLGRTITQTDPDTGTTTSTYDVASNLLTTKDNRGRTLAFGYDALNRRTSEYENSVGATGIELASWTYDTVAKGQLSSSTSYSGSVAGTPGAAYTSAVGGYNDLYEPTSTTISIPASAPAFGGTSYTVGYVYYRGGALQSTSYPAAAGLPAENVDTNYDGFGLESGLTGATTYDSVNRNPIGLVTTHDRLPATGTRQYTSFGYDVSTNALTVIKNAELPAAGGAITTLSNATYTYNSAGDVTKLATSGDGVATDTQCFRYDNLRNLTTAFTPANGDCTATPTATTLGGPAPYWTTYAVSPATGNRTSVVTHPVTGTATTATYAYPAAHAARPHAVSTVTLSGGATGTSSYGYDVDGNATTRPSQTLTWDATGKPTTITTSGVVQTNVYDADGGLLLQSDATSGATLYLGSTELHLAAGASVATATRTYSCVGTTVAERSSNAAGTVKLMWLDTDAQGTVVVQVDADTGAAVARRQDPFGRPRGGSATTWADGHGFLNATITPTAGLVQLGARLYDPTLGRFESVDPVLAPDNPSQNNGYSYAQNNPVTRSDPDGLCSTTHVSAECWSHAAEVYAAQPATAGAPPSAAGGGSSSGSNPQRPKWWGTYVSMRKKDPVGCGQDYNPCPSSLYLTSQQLKRYHMTESAKAIGFWGSAAALVLLFGIPCLAIEPCGLYVFGVGAGGATKALGDGVGSTGLEGPGGSGKSGGGGSSGGGKEGGQDSTGGAKGDGARPQGVPEGWISKPARGDGTIWQEPGATGNRNSVRIMNPNSDYEYGYVRFYNGEGNGQPLDIFGKPGGPATTHFRIRQDGTYDVPEGWWGG